MNKRIERKHLSDEERRVLQLYHEAVSVSFYQFDKSEDEAKAFVGILGKPKLLEGENRQGWCAFSEYHAGKSVSVNASIKPGDTK